MKWYFFSNHADTSAVKEVLRTKGIDADATVIHLSHPYVEAKWSMEELENQCYDSIFSAVSVENLIINGDYSLVSIIVNRRLKLGKPTGFIAFEKLSAKDGAVKLKNGAIKHSNILRPVNIRFIKP